MNFINDDLKSVKCFSKIGRKISKQNLMIYRWNQRKQQKTNFIPMTQAMAKIKYLYNIKALDINKKIDENDINIFSLEDKEKQKLEDFEDEIVEKKKILPEEKKELEQKNNKNNKNKGYTTPKYFFVKKDDDLKRKIQPSCTKYNPKYDVILKRSASSPSWKLMLGRKDFVKPDNSLFYFKPDLIQDNMAGKTFIDFSKQTERKSEFLEYGDKSMNNSKKINRSMINSAKSYRAKIYIKEKSKPIKNLKYKVSKISNNYNSNNTLDSNNSNDSYDLYKHLYTKKLKKKRKIRNSSEQEKNSKSIKSVNFDLIISRENLDSLNNKDISIVPYLFPNYKQVRDRPIMMVVYDRKEPIKNKRKSDEVFYSYNIYNKSDKKVPTPNFDLMYSRPEDNNEPIPSHMKGIFNKNNCFNITGDSLKANNYKNRGFIMPKSSFWKNSFNKYINLKVLKSFGHFSKSFINDKNANIRDKRMLKLYFRNYNDLIQEEKAYSDLQQTLVKSLFKHENKSLEDLTKDLKSKQ